MIEPSTLVGIGSIITAIGTIAALLPNSRKVKSDVENARDDRSLAMDRVIYGRLQKELERMDVKLTIMEEKYEECEAKHEEAIRLITELKSARVGRDLQVNTLERKVSALQEATHVSLPDEESPRV